MNTTETTPPCSLERTVGRHELEIEIAALRPVVKYAMSLNSRRYLPVADRLERLEAKLLAWPGAGGKPGHLGRRAMPPNDPSSATRPPKDTI